MKFESPSFTDLYSKLKSNDRLKKYLIKLGALLVPENFYDEYGFKKNSLDKRTYIEEANNKVYKKLTEVLLEDEDELKSKTITGLINEGILKEEIKDALGFESDISLPKKAYREIYYTYKYCYTDSFFQNNWENFIPSIDFEELNENESASAFMDAIMKEFDKIDYIISHTKDWISIKNIPFEYINYLTQLLGIEVKTFYMKNDTEGKYRELAANILDVYRGRGSLGTFELMFNLLGFTLNLGFYYFDRRRYFAISGENEEFKTTDISSYLYYLTTNNPADNYLDDLATDEIVNLSDFGESHNILNFNELVAKYGLDCVLGYDTEYIENGVQKTYTGDTYTYFKTNYLRIKPKLKYAEGNFSLNQLYQLGKLLDFLTPEFLQRETYIQVETGNSSEPMILNWNRKGTEVFCLLDSEEFSKNFEDKYIYNYKNRDKYGLDVINKYGDYGNSASAGAIPYALNDNGTVKNYRNSLGMSMHLDEDGHYYDVFFNPLSEKIKIINSTEFWGMNKTENSSGAVYPIWKADRNYRITDKNGNTTQYSISANKKEVYLPKDRNAFKNNPDVIKWNKMPVVDLNGYLGYSIRKKMAENSINSGFELRRKIRYVTNLPIELFVTDPDTLNYTVENNKTINSYDQILSNFLEENSGYSSKVNSLKEKINDIIETDKDTYGNEDLFEKEWKPIENFSYCLYAKYNNARDLIQFINNCKGYIINFDYNNNKIFGRFHINILNFKSEIINKKINNYMWFDPSNYSSNKQAIENYNNYRILNLINALTTENCYLIGYITNNSVTEYYVYKYRFVKSIGTLSVNRPRFIPTKLSNINYTLTSYKELLDNVAYENNKIILANNKTIPISYIDLTDKNDYIVRIVKDEANYRLITSTLENRVIIHATNIYDPAYAILTPKNNKTEDSAEILGNVYFKSTDDTKNVEDNFSTSGYSNSYDYLKDIRIPKFYQYRYSNIKRGDLIYCKYDGKVYEFLGDSVYVADSSILASKDITETGKNAFNNDGVYTGAELSFKLSEDKNDVSKNTIFGLRQIQFYGEVRSITINDKTSPDNGKTKYYIYRYDEDYQGFNENDDDDNYILNNYDRTIDWSSIGIQYNDYMKRPIKEDVYKYYDNYNYNNDNKLTFNILKEICTDIGTEISKRDLL